MRAEAYYLGSINMIRSNNITESFPFKKDRIK